MGRFRFRGSAWKNAGGTILFVGLVCLFARLLFTFGLSNIIRPKTGGDSHKIEAAREQEALKPADKAEMDAQSLADQMMNEGKTADSGFLEAGEEEEIDAGEEERIDAGRIADAGDAAGMARLDQNIEEKEYDPGRGQRSARAAAAIWRFWYPAYDWREEAPKTAEEDPPGGWLMKFILKQVPYHREKRGEGPDRSKEPDPAFSSYLESHKVLEEYEYLVQNLSDSAVMSSGSNPLSASPAGENIPGGGKAAGESGAGAGAVKNPEGGKTDLPQALAAGNRILERSELSVTGKEYILDQLADYDFLMKHFYTVHPTTTAGRDMMKAETFLSEDFALTKDNSQPQILIYHTHSQEEFSDYHHGNEEATIVGVGTYLTELLEQKGYRVIHDTSVYDLRDGKLDRSKAYTYALDGITGILQKYPSIQVVLDVHRDGVKEGTRLVSQVNGKQTASIMFFNGTSQTPSGPIEYLKNPYRTDNMAFSFQMKLCADAYFPGYTRKIYLKGLRYNMHLRPRSALIEVGAQTNTYEEARNAMEPLAELLDIVLRPK